MINRLLHTSDIAELYGISMYSARTIMNHVPKINISRGSQRPRWVAKQEDVEAFLMKKSQRKEIVGLDIHGRILRRR